MAKVALLAAVLALFAAMARQAKEQGERPRRIQCAYNVRNIVVALRIYESKVHAFPSGTWPNANLAPEDRLSWHAALSPYYDYAGLYDRIDRAQGWNVGPNREVARMRIGELKCPDIRPDPAVGPVPTPYLGIAGLGTDAPLLPTSDPRAGVFGYDRQTTIANIRDGTGMTMMIAESEHVRDSCLAGGPATVRGLDPAWRPDVGPGCQFGQTDHGGATIGMADGSVRFVSESVAPKVFEALSTIAGGERVPDPFAD
jgi:hypothetical protein